ncbi:DUF4199 domain-containing protein [Aquimarina rubra]|uniref:DUF4199 domain-containing protein n=1 Tax=Aquimarina rubra TaxID=1920033 RepID=A0ABW5L8X2_9FLAO
MKSKSIPIKKYIVKYGILFGIASIIFSLTSYLMGNYTEQGLVHLVIRLFITITSIIIGQLSYRKNNDNYISLGEAIKIGVGIIVLGGLMAIIWEILLLKVIDPEIITELADNQIKKIAENAKDFTLENMDRKIELTNKITSPHIMLIGALAENIFIGFLFSLIGGLIIQKKRDPFK